MANMCMKEEFGIPNHERNVNQTPMQQSPHTYRTAITKTERDSKCCLRCGEKGMLAHHCRRCKSWSL